MPATSRTSVIDAPVDDLWRVVGDPHHLPRWWPKVARVEDVSEQRFTKVLLTKKGRPVRADFDIVRREPQRALEWEQEIEGSPFARFIREQREAVELEPAGEGRVRVTLSCSQRLRGSSRFGAPLVKIATRQLLDEALAGLARAVGG